MNPKSHTVISQSTNTAVYAMLQHRRRHVTTYYWYKKKTQSNCGYSSHQLGTGHKSVLTDGNVEQRLSLGRCHFDVKYAASVGKADYAEDIRSSALHCHCSLLLSAAINSTNLTVLTTVSLPVNVITGSSANYLRQWLVNN